MGFHGRLELVLVRFFAIQHQKTAAARARHLAANRAAGYAQLVHFIYVVVGDIGGQLFFHLPIFSMGHLLFLYLKKIIGATEFIIEFLLAMLACAILTGYVYGMGYHILIAATLTCLGILFVKSPPNWLSFIGKISYSFYLVHGVVIYTTIYYLPKFKESTSGSLITFLLIQAIAIFVSWLFYLAVEKPSSGWGKKINYVKKD